MGLGYGDISHNPKFFEQIFRHGKHESCLFCILNNFAVKFYFKPIKSPSHKWSTAFLANRKRSFHTRWSFSLDSIFNEVLWGAVSLIKVLLCPARTPSHLDTNCLMMGKGWGTSGPFCNSLQPANRSVLESCLFDWHDQEDHRRTQPENWGHTCLCQGKSFSHPSLETLLVMPGPRGRAAGWQSGCCQDELSSLPPPCLLSLSSLERDPACEESCSVLPSRQHP